MRDTKKNQQIKDTKRAKKRKAAINLLFQAAMINLMSINVFASGVMATSADSILQPVKLLQTLFFGLISIIGLIMVGKGILELTTAIPQRDGPSIKEAALQIAGGGIAAAISTVIAFLGLSA